MASARPAPDSHAAREAMIDSQLKPCGVVSPAVVAAFRTVPREAFVRSDRAALAYVDTAQPIGEGRWMMPPLSLGLLVEHLAVRPGERALVVGAGTGYAAALLAEQGAAVTALESDAALAARARALTGRWGVAVVEGPLAEGWAAGAPYDLLLIDGAVEVLPDALVAQVAEGGRLAAIVVGEDGVPRASVGRRAAGRLVPVPVAECGAPLLADFRRPRSFRF